MGKTKRTKRPSSILIDIVLDKSGSMGMVRESTVRAVNDFLREQASVEGEAFVTLTLFDQGAYESYRAMPLREVTELTLNDYQPSGCTALNDATAKAIMSADLWIDSQEQAPDKVLFVVVTDGMENASREYDTAMIRRLIETRTRERGYEFVFMGANIDSFAEASVRGVAQGNTRDFEHSSIGVRTAMAHASAATSAYRQGAVASDYMMAHTPVPVLEDDADEQ